VLLLLAHPGFWIVSGHPRPICSSDRGNTVIDFMKSDDRRKSNLDDAAPNVVRGLRLF